jgi:DhnA family fructose-bisphosphate aldolase class Ia
MLSNFTTPEETLQTFFRTDGRTMILPIDHGTAIPVAGLEKPQVLIESLNPYYDGYVLNYGLAKRCGAVLKDKGLCLRTDLYKPAYGSNHNHGSTRLFGINEALTVNAHAVMNMLYTHHAEEHRLFLECSTLITEGHEVGLPSLIEALPFGIGQTPHYTPENIGYTVRAAAELGADVVKTAYPGDKVAFKEIVDSCFVPVIVLGGAPTDEAGVLKMVEEAMWAGAKGIAIGRNVWQHKNPVAMAQALHTIIHDGATAAQAQACLSARSYS